MRRSSPALDVKVTIIEPNEILFPFLDRELVDEFIHDMRDRGMSIRLQSRVKRVSRQGEACLIELEDSRQIWSEMVLFAAGRKGATDALELENCGLTADDRGKIDVDRNTFRTRQPHIHAVGDVIGFPSLASTSMEQGRIAACSAFDAPLQSPPEFFPYGIYSVPEMSTIGMTEEQVRTKGIPYESGIAAVPRDGARADHGARQWLHEDDLRAGDAALAGRAYRGRRRDGADPYRTGRAEPWRHARLFCREHVQLSHAGRGL